MPSHFSSLAIQLLQFYNLTYTMNPLTPTFPLSHQLSPLSWLSTLFSIDSTTYHTQLCPPLPLLHECGETPALDKPKYLSFLSQVLTHLKVTEDGHTFLKCVLNTAQTFQHGSSVNLVSHSPSMKIASSYFNLQTFHPYCHLFSGIHFPLPLRLNSSVPMPAAFPIVELPESSLLLAFMTHHSLGFLCASQAVTLSFLTTPAP